VISDDEECQGYVTSCVLSFTRMLRLKGGGIGFRPIGSCSLQFCMASHSRKL
jgi:hypothetical protein